MTKTQLKTTVVLCAAFALTPIICSYADDGGKDKDKEKKKEEKAGAEKKSETKGSVTVGGEKIDYTATAGTIQLKNKKGRDARFRFLHGLHPRWC